MNNEQLNAQIDELWAQTKAGNLPRGARFEAIERLTDGYISANRKRPPVNALDRLATLCLYEEVSDINPHKVMHEEDPVLSMYQSKRRKHRELDVSNLQTGKNNTVVGKYYDKQGKKQKIYEYMIKNIQ